MKKILLFCLFATALLSCRAPTAAKVDPAVFKYFPLTTPFDTLRIMVAAENLPPGDTIPNSVFFAALPDSMQAEIEYLADSTQALVIGRGRWNINDSITVCWADIRQFWFMHHSLLFYNRTKQNFTERITAAEFYGGDGGQNTIGSWIFDYDGDGDKDIVHRELLHYIDLQGEEPEPRDEESAALMLWRNGRFEGVPSDTAALVRRYPMEGW